MLFADIVGFTRYCESHAAEDVVANLECLVEAGEALMSKHGLERIKTVGRRSARDWQPAPAPPGPGDGRDPVRAQPWRSGRCQHGALADPGPASTSARVVAGMVGRSKFSFDLWGDTVNVAARLSTLGAIAAVHLSADAWRQVAGRCRGEPLGPVVVKGKGERSKCIGVSRSCMTMLFEDGGVGAAAVPGVGCASGDHRRRTGRASSLERVSTRR